MIPGGMSDLTIAPEDPHDPLCPVLTDGSCACETILAVRADERYDSPDHRKPFQDGYLIGRNVAALAIKEFADRISNPYATHYPGCWRSHVSCALVLAADIAVNEE